MVTYIVACLSLIQFFDMFLQSPESGDSSLVRVLHWGGVKKAPSFPNSERLVELGARQIVPSDGQCLILTVQGTVYSLSNKGPGEFSETVSEYSSSPKKLTELQLYCFKY